MFRECWEQEFKILSCGADAEQTLDDFVLLCTFLGNKALPSNLRHLETRLDWRDNAAGIPTLHLLEGSLDELLSSYKEFLAPSLEAFKQDQTSAGYGTTVSPYLINSDRSVNLMNLEAFIQLVGTETKELNRLQFREKLQSSNNASKKPCLICQEAVGMIYYEDSPYKWWKDWYYTMKFKMVQGDRQARKEQAGYYLNGLVWYFAYLTRGICCWDYAYHEAFAPTLSDLTSISEMEGEKGFLSVAVS